jgi:hypothetical protein
MALFKVVLHDKREELVNAAAWVKDTNRLEYVFTNDKAEVGFFKINSVVGIHEIPEGPEPSFHSGGSRLGEMI